MKNNSIVLVLLTFIAGFPACSGEAEVFEKTVAALEAEVGAACEVQGGPVSADEVVVEESDTCAPAICLGIDGQASCSCRCSGDPGNGPLCDCPDTFHCEQLIDDLGLGHEEDVGGYCVADP